MKILEYLDKENAKNKIDINAPITSATLTYTQAKKFHEEIEVYLKYLEYRLSI